jgi:PhoPQ-activated pathogenicity-related protein
LNNIPVPNFKWENRFEMDRGVLTVQVQDKPIAVRLWFAVNVKARNFMMKEIGRTWQAQDLVESSNGNYVGIVLNPHAGYRAYFIEVQYSSRSIAPMKFTTSTFVVPNTFPCGDPFLNKTK